MTWEELVLKFKGEQMRVKCITLEQRHTIKQIIADHEPEENLRFLDDDYKCKDWPYVGCGDYF